MAINIDGEDLKHGVMGLVIAVVEILKDALKHQAVRRMEAGTLNAEEIERLGAALMGIDRAVDEIKEEYGVKEAVVSVREGLDQALNDIFHAATLATGPGLETRVPRETGKRRHDEKNPKEIETP
ncbi:MAG: gas vesicle protein K [Deltaproteobacteria bacterium]|nr:gas vesicle protein K [Deltaproteobacteria bacterium]